MKWDRMPFRRRPARSEATGAFRDCYVYLAANGRWRLAWPGLPNGARDLSARSEEAALIEAESNLRGAVMALAAALEVEVSRHGG